MLRKLLGSVTKRRANEIVRYSCAKISIVKVRDLKIVFQLFRLHSILYSSQHWVCCKLGLTLYPWAFYHYQHQLGRTSIAGLLFVKLYFYNFIQQRFRAGRAMNASPAASPARCKQPQRIICIIYG